MIKLKISYHDPLKKSMRRILETEDVRIAWSYMQFELTTGEYDRPSSKIYLEFDTIQDARDLINHLEAFIKDHIEDENDEED